MKAERLFRVLGLADPLLVEEAIQMPVKRKTSLRRWGVLAACLTLIVGAGFGWLITGGFRGYGSSAPGDNGSSGAEGSGITRGIAFMSYAGPVFPMATIENPVGLTAEREITWDLAPGTYADGSPRQWGANVSDAYILRNSADVDIIVTALYPFAGNFNDLDVQLPTVTVDGDTVEPVLYAGAYSGSFQSTFGAVTPDTMNLDNLNSWKEYKTLLENGEYLTQALGSYPVLDTPVTVYQFSDFQAPLEKYQAATQAISFTIDEARTRIFTYGFNGSDWAEGFRRYSYFVPDGMRSESDLKMLVVLGDDIENYILQGYEDGGCHEDEKIDGVSCSITRTETTLDAVLDRLCRYYQKHNIQAADRDNAYEAIPLEMFRGAVAELLADYGAFADKPMDRYSDGRLDDVISETLTHDRVLYLAFPVTVPAGGSIGVDCTLWKAPSFDYNCSGSENVGLQGYDLVTRLGSGLEFTSQQAALANAEGVELVNQNFGFDLENGVSAVDLDPNQEHYFMEFRADEQ